MTSALRGGGGQPKSAAVGEVGDFSSIDWSKLLTGGSEIPKIEQTSFVHGSQDRARRLRPALPPVPVPLPEHPRPRAGVSRAGNRILPLVELEFI